jgi:dTDP-4-dehydrorhamnose reductase
MNILVTGANGQLGKCIRDRVKMLKETDNIYIFSDVVGSEDADTEYLDIVDEEMVKNFVKNSHINIIINCAAYTNVDKAENDYEDAEAINAIAPRNLAEAALSVGAKLIHISTDYVFNGQGFMPYTEERMTLPISVYGKTKRMGEEFIQKSGCKYLIFRTAWLYSEYGNNFVKTMLRLFNEKDEINVVNDQIGTPTYAGNLADLIVNIVETMAPIEGKETIPLLENGIYHFTDEGVASWYDFANRVYMSYITHEFRNGKKAKSVKINGVTTKEYASKTKRPYYSVLNKTKYKTDFKGLYEPQNWCDGVNNVVNKLLNNQ